MCNFRTAIDRLSVHNWSIIKVCQAQISHSESNIILTEDLCAMKPTKELILWNNNHNTACPITECRSFPRFFGNQPK